MQQDQPSLRRLSHALTSFVDLQYFRLEPNQFLFDGSMDEGREDAVQNFLNYVSDSEEDEVEETRRELAWVLRLPEDRFEEIVRQLNVPVPRFDIAEIRRLLELLWERAWPDEDWRAAI
jgi:hypothetical protein